ALKEAESMSESLKSQLNDLCRFSKDLSSHSNKVSSLIKEYNSLCLQTAKYCQNKEKALEQRFRATFREFQQWMINTKITTCFDTPQNIDEATAIIQKLQDFLSESETCQSKLNTLISKGELLSRILRKEKAEAIQAKVSTAKEDWKNLLANLHQKEAALQNLQSQMKDFEAGVGPVQEWLVATEAAVQGSSSQLPDLLAKKNEQFRLQSVLEDIASREPQLNKLKEKAQHLWEEQASNKSFMHRVSQLSACYLALSNLAKEKALRVQRTVSEHQQFSQGLKELQDWLADARHMLESYCTPTAEKNLLDSRMAKVEALLALRQEKEIQLKMVLTRGESVLRSTSPEGTPTIHKQMDDLKDSWDSLLSFSIQCKSHRRLLETIQAKGESMAQHYVTQLELQELQERFNNLSEKAKDLERHCTEGQTLMSTALRSQEKMTLSGSTYMEDRILESAQRDWHLYQRRLVETKEKVNATLTMLRRLEKMFQQVDSWLSDLESKVNLRSGRQSDRGTKETQLQQLQKWNEEILARKDEVESVGLLAHQVLEESHINSSVGSQATHLAARYQGILLHVVDQTKLLREELRALDEADAALNTYTDWLRAAQKNFKNMAVALNVVDKIAMERKIKKFESLHNDIDMGNSLLKMILEKGEKAIEYLEGPEAQSLRESMDGHIGQLNELTSSIRRERGTLEKCLYLTKEFLDKYQSQTKWLAEYQAILQIPVDPKVELYEKKAQLAKYKVRVQALEETVSEHEDYNSNLQEVEKWLLQISTRLVAPDTTQSTNLEIATQNLARHKPIMEEIAGFEHALASLRSKGDGLIANCTEELQGRFKHQVQGHLQGIRDSYSAICSTAERLYQSLERELQRHVSHQDTLQQCQAWIHSVQQELEPHAHPPISPQKSLKQVKYYRALQEQASTYLELLCSMCDLSNDTVKKAAAGIQYTKQAIEQHLVRSQELALGWEEIKRQKAELAAYFLDSEQQLQSLKRRPAEMELKIVQKQLAQVQELGHQFQSRQAHITALTEKVSILTEGHESPEHSEIGQLSNQWLELCHQINALHSMREEDQQRARDYHDQMSIVEVLLDKFTKEWDNLARMDAESTAEHLEALKKLASIVQAQTFVVDDLKEQKQKLMDRLNPEDKELVKEQTSHFEKQWAHLEDLIEKKIQVSVLTLEELSQCQSKLDDLVDWADGQTHLFAEALRCSPPAELAQTLLLDHIAICNELESQQLTHGAVTEEAEKILARLGLDERQRLQRALSALHGKMSSLSEAVGQRRKYLSKALSDRTQFLMAVSLAINWIQQNERVATSQEHVALLPLDVGKQIRTCKNVSARLKEYQADVTALWAQGRELAKDATEEETAEIMSQLQELQSMYDSALQQSGQRLQELEKILVSRKYFKADLDKVCHWLKQADIVTFPQISLMSSDAELSSQLSKYQQLLEQSPEYENLLLLVQRTGRELLPSLSEADHSFLDEKLNVLPKQFNCIVALAKEKSDKIQEAIAGRKEYVSLIDLTSKALSELEDQVIQMTKVRLGLSSKEVLSAQSDLRALLGEVLGLGKAVDDLNQRKETFRSSGQPWQPDEMAGLASLHGRLRRQIELRVGLLDDTAAAYQEHEVASLQLETQLRGLGEELVKINEETLSIEEKLKNYHALAGGVQDASSLLKRLVEQVEQFSPELESGAHEARGQQIQAWKDELQSTQGTISARIMECESRLVQRIDFQTEIQRTLDWLRQIKGDLCTASNLDIKLQSIQEEIRKSQILEEEVQSSLRIMAALSSKEKEKYTESRELIPPQVESNLLELSKLETEVQETLSTRKASMDQLQALMQRYQQAIHSASIWLDDASALLQQTGDGLDVEGSEETLRRHVEFFTTEAELASQLGELEALIPGLLPSINLAGREQVEQNLASLRQRRGATEQQAQGQQEILQRCVAHWQDYQETRQQVIALMNQAEKKLSEFSSAKAATSHESEEKLTQHKSLLSVVNSFHEKITALEEQASHLESLGNDASKATISRSMTTVWQRWTRLRTVAREQEKMLEEAARGWKNLTDKIETTTVVVDQLQDRLPDSSVEKARKTELLELLEYHDAFAQEVEGEQSTLTVLRQQALNMLRDVAMPSTSVEDLPVMHEIKAMQDRYDNVRQKIRKSRKMVQQELKEREEVESELNVIKQWLHETREYLLNPTSDAVTELRELKELHTEVAARHQTVERLGNRQRDKYLELYTILPSELSEQLAEVTLALGAIEEQVNMKEGEVQQMQAVTLDFNCRMQQISDELNDISRKLKEKGTDIVQAKIEHKRLWDKLDSCNVKLVELDATMQDFTEQNPQQSKCLTDDMTKLSSLYQQVFKVTEYRASKLNKAASQLEEFHEMLDFVLKWLDKAKNLGYSAINWHSAAQLNDQLITYQATLRESEEMQSDLQAMSEKLDSVSEVYQTSAMSQRVSNLRQQTEEFQQLMQTRLQSLQDAAKDMEQFETEVKSLQAMVKQAQITLTSPELTRLCLKEQLFQRQIAQDFAQKIKGYQEQIAALNTKCKMLTMKAKHATMLLTVTEVEGLSEGMEELDGEPLPTHSTHPSVVMDSAYYGTLSVYELQTAAPDAQDMNVAASLQEPFETTLGDPASSKLDDLQRSWETLKNVISEKQRTLYEALERQQKYQDSVQSVSAKMESIEGKLGEALDADKSHDVQMAAHQALMDEIVTLQDEINELQICFAEELVSDTVDADTSDQLAMQSTLTVLAERMATIKMKALGKKQLLEERLNEQVEDQRQEQALKLYCSEADELDNWLLITKAALDATLQVSKEQVDMEDQLIDCQNMLVEIEQKVAFVSELFMNSENLLMQGKPQTREQAENLTEKLRNLKGSLTELQRMLQDRSITIKHGVVQEKEDTEIDSTFHSSPSVQEWLVQARATRYQHQQNSLQRQKELEQQLTEQKNLLRLVASSGEKIMTQQSSMEAVSEEQRSQAIETARPETLPQELGFEGEKLFALQQLRIKWQNLQKEISTKQKMFQNTLEQNQERQQVYGLSSGVSSGMALFKGEAQTLDKSVQMVKSLLTGLGQAFGNLSPQGKDAQEQSLPLEQKLYDATTVTSHWLDGVEDHLFASADFLPEKVEAHLYHEEALAKDIEEVIEEVKEKKGAFFHILPEPKNQEVIEETLSCLQERLHVLGLTVKQQCERIKDHLQQLMEYQTELKLLITSLADSKYIVLQKLAEALEHPVTEQLQAILQAEDDLREFETQIGHLKERGDDLQPDQAILLDLSKAQDMYEELTMIVGSSRSSLNQSLALRSQYEQALQDLADLTDTGQEKMSLDKRILVTSREDVKNLLDKHKEFFQGLESHKILIETLCKKVSTCIHQKETSSQQELMSKTAALLKEAHKRGVELESILETWTNLAKDYEALYRQLEGVESNIPGAGLVEESEERLTERIALYQRLKGSLTEHQPQLYQVLEDEKRLLMSISCSDLEVQIAQLGEHWLSSTTRVSRELHRLETVLKHWNRYQAEYAELNQWLQSAIERLEFWKLQSVTLPQELDTVRDHLSSFLEFSKEVDTKSSLKSSVLSRGNQLLRLKKVDTAALRSGLAQTDSQWTELLTQIPLVQEKLHQLQMEKLPSRTAINELMNWISLMDQIIEEDDKRIKSAVGSQMIQQCLKKYKAFKIDLTCKQLTVDFVNQSVLQISSHDVESKRSDKTDFAERLGVMNRRWQLLQGLITEKIRSLEGSLESWTEYENSVRCLKTWFETQEEKLKKWHSINDLASVHTALKDCQELEDVIRVKEKEVEKVEQSGLLLIQNKKEEVSSSVMETLRELNHSWAHLDHLVGQLKITLQSVLDQWNIYKDAFEEINGHMMDARYSLSRFRLLTGSLEAVKIQVDNLQKLQEELERSECSLRKFDSMSNQLLKECQPPVNSLLTTNLNEVNTSWNNLHQDIMEQLHSSKVLLQLWQKYRDFSSQCSVTVQQQEEKSNELIKKVANRDIAEEEVTKWIQDCDAQLEELGTVRDSLHVLSDLGEELRQQVDSSAAAAIQSDQLSLTQRLASLEQALSRQRTVLQAGIQDYEVFSRRLEALEKWIVEADEVLKSQDPNRSSDLTIIQDRMEELKVQMLRFSSTVPDLDRLNELGYRLPLNDKEIKRMQTLNRHWSSISAQTTERFSKLQAFLLQHQTFLEKCETWMEFLVQTEQKLAVEISGNYQNLLEQQRAHELFQAEMFSRQQILHSIISDGQHLLEQGQVDDRDEFNSKLAMLSNQWQGVIRRAQQRRGIIDSQIRQWQRYREMAEKLRKWLLEVSQQLERRWSSVAPIALQQARALLDEVQDWERCEKGIAVSLTKLRSFKKKLSQPLPDHQDELHTEQIRCMELESSFGGWTDDLAHLSFLRETLSSYIRADDISLLQERIELLHRQWDELCYQVSLRRQLVTEKLNEWALFNEKNKELCEWLTLMESKVSQNGDISIEEMIEKLKKDYQEEITAARENKMQLQQMGQRLIRASHESKASEIEYKLGKVDDRWQHLLDLIGARVKKLKETLVAVQQLDKNMSSLRSWLAQIETELSRPIVYDSCDSTEIQQKLVEQQELQRDIEKHSTGVASVLNLCEVLLHDCDACATETECDSIQQATRNLDRRWRNICAMSMERRLKIEETWRLWQKFLDDYSRFEDWLETSERTAAVPNSSGVLYTVAKEELKKFEAFQRQVHESLTQLELINKQYRRLARENRTDSGSKLKDMVHEGNQRWDILQRRVTAILRRLKHFIGQREEFETTRESILVWLTEMDLQLTNIEHFSECDVQAKIKQLKAFQQEISLHMSRIEKLFDSGEQLIEKSEPMDAAVIEEELEELQRYYQEVFGRVDRYYRKLMQLPLTDDEHEVSDREMELDENIELSSMQWLDRAPDSSATPPLSLSRGTSLQQSKDTRSGRDTPASVDSIPLEWDHDYDLSRNLESAVSRALAGAEEDAGDEDSNFYLKGAAEITDVVIPESPEAYVKLTESTLRSTAGEPGHLETQIRQLDKALDSSRYHLQQTENAIRSKTPTGPELDSSYWGYMKLLSECRGSIETVKRVGHKLKEEEDKLSGLINLTSTETQTSGVIERWELIQAQALNKELRMKQNLQQWQQFNSDLDSIWEWLSETEEELEHLDRLETSTDIQTIELRIKKLKELQKAVDNRKAIILSINLCSTEFTQSDTGDVLELRDRLSQMNKRWDRVGSLLGNWRCALQDALMQCHDFHEMSHGLLLWLENIDRRRNEILPIDPNLDSDTLQDHHKTLMQIRRELLESQLKVASLQDMSSQLLVNAEGRDCLEAKEKVHVIGNRLKLLLKEVTQDLKELERLLDMCGSQADLVSWSSADDLDSSGSLSPVSSGGLPIRSRPPRGKCSLSQPGTSVSGPHSRPHKGSQRDSSHSKEQRAQKRPSFFLRVIRAALPLQLLLLLLIALACLVPMTEEDYSCATSNNFARSFHPMLRYTNGPPPI
ncbi:hypothetical protein scyTo_0005735, partial [Scyliorhinus torazame]|nr:hypothetical protein [Scyliorhinus torazame]